MDFRFGVLFLFFLGIFSCVITEKEFYIIPKNYKGPVIVIFNQKGFPPLLKIDGYRLYKIPENGILITQSKRPQKRFINREYYFEDYKKKLNVIKIFPDTLLNKNSLNSEIRIYGSGTVGVLGNTSDNNPLEFCTFEVGTFNDSTNFFNNKAFQEEIKKKIKRGW